MPQNIEVILLALLALLQLIGGFVLLFYSLRNQHESNQMLGRLLGPAVAATPVPAKAPTPAPTPVPTIAPSPVSAPAVPAWFTWASNEVGFHETGNNGGIEKYIGLSHCGTVGDPWCAIFANAALEASGVPGTRSPSSQSFRTSQNFIPLQAPRQGALAVFWRGAKDSGLGHVGFYVSDNATTVRTLGGNENDAVRIEDLPKDSASFGLIGYWWPKSVPLTGTGPVSLPAAPTPILSTAPAHQSGITATMFGGPKSAYGGPIDDSSLGVALPFHFTGERPRVRVTSKAGAIECAIVDVGPWNTNDPYWQTSTRPQAESGTDMTGRKTNKAGIDLTLAAAKALQIDGKGLVDWEFVTSPFAPNVS
jgi:uncharacterized protein (TIGR02594 family)